MKKTIVTTLAMLIAVNLFAQNSLTNKVAEFLMYSRSWDSRHLMSEIADTFKACINLETNYESVLAGINEIYSSDGIKTKEQQKHDIPGMMKFVVTPEMAFTNATLEEVIGTFIDNMPNHIWRYDCEKDVIYVQPATNAFSMTRIGPVSINNDTIFEFEKTLSKYDLDLWPRLVSYKINGNKRNILRDLFTLEFENAYLYEILDAVIEQIPDARGWTIFGKRIYLHSTSED